MAGRAFLRGCLSGLSLFKRGQPAEKGLGVASGKSEKVLGKDKLLVRPGLLLVLESYLDFVQRLVACLNHRLNEPFEQGTLWLGLRIKIGRMPLMLLVTFYNHRVLASFRTVWAMTSQKRSVGFLMRKP